MRNFVQYHNTEDMGYSVSKLTEPKIHTHKSVRSLSSNRVWLISGEGKSPKAFYLAAVFKVTRTSTDTFDDPNFENAAYGVGHIIGEKIALNGLPWFEVFKSKMKNFKNGLSEITDIAIVAELEKAAAPYTS